MEGTTLLSSQMSGGILEEEGELMTGLVTELEEGELDTEVTVIGVTVTGVIVDGGKSRVT